MDLLNLLTGHESSQRQSPSDHDSEDGEDEELIEKKEKQRIGECTPHVVEKSPCRNSSRQTDTAARAVENSADLESMNWMFTSASPGIANYPSFALAGFCEPR